MEKIKIFKEIFAVILFVSVIVSACNKESHTRHVARARVPYNTVPELFAGDFTWKQVRNAGVNNQYGDSYSELSVGTTAHINKNGTGTWVFHYDITGADGRRTSVRIDSEVTYEITALRKNRARIIVHFLRGKNYMDDKFQHDLEESDLYPNGDFVYDNVEYGRNEAGQVYFNTEPGITFLKK
ncbi:MAG TPA: hypothetical protein VEZ17_11225 [Chitinophagaceae bacterium]|jgi:hypothetical protein|nr:hypothetical protein [Chitinophagaceae bacterium]